ncbi:hypothetical protein FRC12_006523 [Ceratobasidium sp. 428]|nr:hypothetical protein FRC12_006523 [Ceratobasidium sp. 428]
MSDVSAPAQTRDLPCVGPATPSHKRDAAQVAGVKILLTECLKHRVLQSYFFRRDEHKTLDIGYDVYRLLGVCGEGGLVPPDTWSKDVQLTWENNTLQAIGSGPPPCFTYFVNGGQYRRLKPHLAYTITDKTELELQLRYCDQVLIDFVYEDQPGTEATKTKSPSDHSQTTTPITQPQPAGGPGSALEKSPENAERVSVDLTVTEDDESDKEVNDIAFLKVVQHDHQKGASSDEGGHAPNRQLTAQGKKRKCIDKSQCARPSTRTRVGVSVGTQTSPTPTPTPSPTERSEIRDIGLVAVTAAAMWGALTFELI